LSAARDVIPTTQRSAGRDEHIKGVPQPKRWAAFVKSAGEGKVEQVSDQPFPVPRLRGAAASEIFNGKFRAEAKRRTRRREKSGRQISSRFSKSYRPMPK
jgi:hypothetical protein